MFIGGNCEDHENAQEADKCCLTNRTGRDPQKHVLAFQEAHQGADRVAN